MAIPKAGLDADALAACAAGADGLRHLSAERITAELRKLLSAARPRPAVAAMAHCGVLAQVLPGGRGARLARAGASGTKGMEPDFLRRLVVLGGETKRLRLTRQKRAPWNRCALPLADLQTAAALGYALGQKLAESVLLARAALLETPLPQDWQTGIARGAQAQFPLRASDLPHLQGPALGAELRRLEQVWIASNFSMRQGHVAAPDWPLPPCAPISGAGKEGRKCYKKPPRNQSATAPHSALRG
jgi:poly(A) polymerase